LPRKERGSSVEELKRLVEEDEGVRKYVVGILSGFCRFLADAEVVDKDWCIGEVLRVYGGGGVGKVRGATDREAEQGGGRRSH